MAYLIDLTVRIAAGIGRLDESLRQRHAQWLASAQRPDGGFAGRQGASDPYYTSFGLRSLAMLGALTETQARLARGFLLKILHQAKEGQSTPQGGLRPADFTALVYSAVLLETLFDMNTFAEAGLQRQQAVLDHLLPLRRADGGYAKSARSGTSSTYQTFLAATCLELVGLPIPQPMALIDLIHTRRRHDGGFVEMGLLERSGTNPTAAAIALLRLLGAVDEQTRQSASTMLLAMQGPEGGLRANQQIPAADLLSSFTGLVALVDLEMAHGLDTAALARYAASLGQADGGFRSGPWDDAADVEYTFYGLGLLGLLAAFD